MLRISATVAACALVLAGCGRQPSRSVESAAAPVPATVDDAGHPKIVALGDSLTAGFGLLEMQAYAAGLQRLDWALQAGNVRILILELGANDGLRGLPVAEMKKNLAAIIERAQSRQIAVLLIGMEAPPNFGLEYVAAFRQVFRDLAHRYHVPFVPFMLNKVAGVSSLNQSDGIHPNTEGTRIVADTIWSTLRPMVDATGGS
jgi:acyl-CoA thioesterase-1